MHTAVQTPLPFSTTDKPGSFIYFIACRKELLEEETNLFEMTHRYIHITAAWPWLGKLSLWITSCHLLNFLFYYFPSSSALITLLAWFTYSFTWHQSPQCWPSSFLLSILNPVLVLPDLLSPTQSLLQPKPGRLRLFIPLGIKQLLGHLENLWVLFTD